MPSALLALDIADDATAWARAGFTIADGAVHLDGIVLRMVGPGIAGERGIVAWALGQVGPDGGRRPRVEDGGPGPVADDGDPVPATAVEGLTQSGAPTHDPTMLPPSATRHANGAFALDHLVIATPDLDRTTSELSDLGWEARRTTPAPQGDARTMRFVLATLGGTGTHRTVVELIHDPVGGPATTTFWGLAVTTDRLDAAVRRIGSDAIGQPRTAVQVGRRIATVRGRHIGLSVPLALMSPRP